jgi:large subunit ribosomal protein L30
VPKSSDSKKKATKKKATTKKVTKKKAMTKSTAKKATTVAKATKSTKKAAKTTKTVKVPETEAVEAKATLQERKAPAGKLRITQVRSGIGHQKKYRRTLRALGLKHHQDMVVVDDNPSMRGMLFRVRHLVKVAAEEA